MKTVIGLILIAVALITVVYIQITNRDATEMRLWVDHWPTYILSFTFLTCGWYLINTDDK